MSAHCIPPVLLRMGETTCTRVTTFHITCHSHNVIRPVHKASEVSHNISPLLIRKRHPKCYILCTCQHHARQTEQAERRHVEWQELHVKVDVHECATLSVYFNVTDQYDVGDVSDFQSVEMKESWLPSTFGSDVVRNKKPRQPTQGTVDASWKHRPRNCLVEIDCVVRN